MKIKGCIVESGIEYSKEYLQTEVNIVKNFFEQIKCYESGPVAIIMNRTYKYITTMIALYELEIPFLPIDINMPVERIKFMVKNANCKIAILNEKIISIEGVTEYTYLELLKYSADDCYKKFGNKIAYILYTSGSTGQPKGVEVTRIGLENFIQAIPKVIPVDDNLVLASFTSFSFDIVFLETIASLYYGLKIYLATDTEVENAKYVRNLIIKNKVNILQFTPSRLKLLNEIDENLIYLENIKILLIGGEMLSLQLLEKIQQRTSARIFNLYGPTETTIWSTVSELTNKKEIDVGMPIDNTEIYIMDTNDNILEYGCTGEICISGAGVANGYINNLEQTKTHFIQKRINGVNTKLYRTGDLGYVDKRGVLFCLGRMDSQVKMHGYRIELEEIDTVILKMHGISHSATCYDAECGELVNFYVSASDIRPNEIYKHLSQILPYYMLPQKIVNVEKFDYTTSGKLSKKEMLSHYKRKSKGNLDKKAHNYSIEEIILEIIKKKLESEELQLSSKLDEIGIDSLNYVSIIVEIEEEFDIEFDDDLLVSSRFESIENIAQYVKESVNF